MKIASARDVVVLTGWARRPHRASEAALMADLWDVEVRRMIVDHDATTTVGNALQALETVEREQPGEVIIVTSHWHARRARAAFRQILGGVPLSSSSPAEAVPVVRAASELPRWLLLPAQVGRARRNLRRVRTSDGPSGSTTSPPDAARGTSSNNERPGL